jgi:Protein of unknown function (DUF3106)
MNRVELLVRRSHFRFLGSALAVALLWCVVGSSVAEPTGQDRPRGVAWSELSADQQQLLSRFEQRWSQLPPRRQMILERSSRRWLKMTPEQRVAMTESFEKFHHLNDQERGRIKERMTHFQDLSPEEQQKLRDSYGEFRRLSDERRKQLKEQWERLSPEEREAWRRRYQQRHGEPNSNRSPEADNSARSPQ